MERLSRCALALWLLLAGCVRTVATIEIATPAAQPTFESEIRPILEQRCVVCHSCNNAPCQLNLQSFEGVERGASKQLVYDATRLVAAAPTRMFQDARTTAQWRALKFFPVVSHSRIPIDSVLYHFVANRRADPRGGDFEAEKGLGCVEGADAARQYLEARPGLGMPYGFPPLDDAEFETIGRWLSAGAPGSEPQPAPKASTRSAIHKWEQFFAADDLRTQLVSRYLYEHLFLAHLYFATDERDFYRLVRSRSAAPQPVDEIVTVRPNDDPKVSRVHYRLVRVTETIVHKTHVPFALTDAKLSRFKALFLAPKWTIDTLPSWEPAVAGNPFVAFAAIPARARYQFMLDDAYYHVRAFIHGPVCKGQVALNVIDEQFWIMFLAPDSDLSVTDPEFLRATAEDLSIPAEGKDTIEAFYGRFKPAQLRYLKKRNEFYASAQLKGRGLTDLWNGGGRDRDALLTVFRHFDSASVSRGALGGVPKTGWVLDYPIFERIYYELVAGFSVYGNVVHQLATRQYMDNLRVEAEDGFLRLMPLTERPKLRAAWYRGAGVDAYMALINPFFDNGLQTRVEYKDPAKCKEEFWTQVKTKLLTAQVVGASHQPPEVMRSLADRAAPYAQVFPDVTLLRVGDDVYTIVRNRAHLNVAFAFLETQYREPKEDTLTIVKGSLGSYPNLLIVAQPGQVARFLEELGALRPDDDSWTRFVDAWGVRRSSKDFWTRFDWFVGRALEEDKIEGGLLDLNRYLND